MGLSAFDVPIESIPLALRKPGVPVWVVWNRTKWELEAIFPRTTEDGSDLPDHWRAMFAKQKKGS